MDFKTSLKLIRRMLSDKGVKKRGSPH